MKLHPEEIHSKNSCIFHQMSTQEMRPTKHQWRMLTYSWYNVGRAECVFYTRIFGAALSTLTNITGIFATETVSYYDTNLLRQLCFCVSSFCI